MIIKFRIRVFPVILKNIGFLVTQNEAREVYRGADIEIVGDEIARIGRGLSGEVEIDCSDRIVMPGLVNTHTHAAMTLLRGISDNKVLQDWLHEDIFPAEEAMTGEDAYYGALLASMEMLSTGTTCFNDMYFHMDEVARTVDETGIRALLSRGLTDIDGKAYDSFLEAEDFVQEYSGHGTVTPGIAPHAIYTCSAELLQAAKGMAEKHGAAYHIHVSETEKENQDSRREHGLTPVQYLDGMNLLDGSAIVAHATWLEDADLEILAERGAGVAHNPAANLKLGNGVADVPAMLDRGISVGIGTDGPASNNSLNMFEEAKLAGLLHKREDPRKITEQQVLDMLTVEGARVLGLEQEIGSIEEGKKADLVFIDVEKPSLAPFHGKRGLLSNLVFSFNGDVSEVMVDGEFVYTGEGFNVDAEHVLEQVQQRAKRLSSHTE